MCSCLTAREESSLWIWCAKLTRCTPTCPRYRSVTTTGSARCLGLSSSAILSAGASVDFLHPAADSWEQSRIALLRRGQRPRRCFLGLGHQFRVEANVGKRQEHVGVFVVGQLRGALGVLDAVGG